MNSFGWIRKILNKQKARFEEKRDLARTQVLMNEVDTLLKKSWKEFPDIPPKDTPYGEEIQERMKEAEDLMRKQGVADGS